VPRSVPLEHTELSARQQVLIATNVIARGIDVMSVNMVVNYDMPWDPVEKKPDVETYLHRSRSINLASCSTLSLISTFTVGRTGRFGRQGICEYSRVTKSTVCH